RWLPVSATDRSGRPSIRRAERFRGSCRRSSLRPANWRRAERPEEEFYAWQPRESETRRNPILKIHHTKSPLPRDCGEGAFFYARNPAKTMVSRDLKMGESARDGPPLPAVPPIFPMKASSPVKAAM